MGDDYLSLIPGLGSCIGLLVLSPSRDELLLGLLNKGLYCYYQLFAMKGPSRIEQVRHEINNKESVILRQFLQGGDFGEIKITKIKFPDYVFKFRVAQSQNCWIHTF